MSFGSRHFFETCVSSHQFHGLSVGYELKVFRYSQLADLMFKALPDFALNYSERANISVENVVDRLRKAAKIVYATDKYKRRGEFGELLLHLVMKDFFETIPAISKMYYKDGPNETVKGFDAVHVVVTPAGLELWVGETKFYESISKAISDVSLELQVHAGKEYLKTEFLFIGNKIEDDWPHAEDLRKLLDPNTSLDTVFKRMRIVVLITYDSSVVQTHQEVTDVYKAALCQELDQHHHAFRSRNLPQHIDIVLVLVPLEFKKNLVEILHSKLEALQQL